ncbi:MULTISPECIES: hypothetical protein [Streptomyces]|uniref:Uncharacterized protein n=1 Tax=Streptomyces gilvifuscus TaxID=1550617 RepID=A0ABT5G431_9ACTN|nr:MULTISPECIES: hypothetical protein [Streptomyces]MBK3646835.1 hypothetical protein [Streptomyces sp. MBT33]MDC2959366.1 hypothetical protein [Streptomyces gilvifuscus]
MSDPIQEIVKRLPDLESVTEVWDTAERRVEQGDIAFVADLGSVSHNVSRGTTVR